MLMVRKKTAVVGRDTPYYRTLDNLVKAEYAHPGRYVAVDENGLIATGKTFTSASLAARRKKKHGRFAIGTAPTEVYHGIASL